MAPIRYSCFFDPGQRRAAPRAWTASGVVSELRRETHCFGKTHCVAVVLVTPLLGPGMVIGYPGATASGVLVKVTVEPSGPSTAAISTPPTPSTFMVRRLPSVCTSILAELTPINSPTSEAMVSRYPPCLPCHNSVNA